MLADGKHGESLLTVRDLSCGLEGARALPLEVRQGGQFPLPPAMPDAVLLLRLLLSSHSADLHAISDVVRNDVGLTLQLLHLAARECREQSASTLNVADLIVQLGLEKLKRLAAATKLNPIHPRSDGPQAREQFWRHARLTARISEELAAESIALSNREAAYVGGLLRHLGALPALLGWEMPAWMPTGIGEIGYRLAKSWDLPSVLADVIRGDDRTCTSQNAHALLRLVNVADERAARWESNGTPMRSAWAWS